MRDFMPQRGYSLVEMMIALAVLGLVIGGALVPLKARYEQEQINSAQQHLEQAKEAVLAYSLSQSTAGSAVMYYDNLVYPLPPNRPYLPCPDVTGDGEEDRNAMPDSYPVVAMTLASAGACQELKGMLPWKTLGVRELDPWGSRLTYRVDPSFSSRLYGFDETFRADSSDVAAELTITAGGDRQYKQRAGPGNAFDSLFGANGAVICSRHSPDPANCPLTTRPEVGVVTGFTQLTIGPRPAPGNGGTIDGLVFVIVSHGKNGHGAINRNNTCRPLPPGVNRVQFANAYYRTGHPFYNASSFGCVQRHLWQENTFMSSIIDSDSNEVSAPDDLLIWSGRHELFGLLARSGRLPLAKLEYLP